MTGHILIVEDNPITRKMMRVALEVSGFSVAEAGTALEALASAKADPPMLILQDLLLPDMNGLDLVREFRTRTETADVPIIALSGLLSRLNEARTVRAGFTDYLFKPVEVGRLRQTIARVLAPGAGEGIEGSGRRLLLVDDDDVQRKLNRIQLQNLGFEVTSAPDGPSAIDAARETPPDVIVTDLLMPGMNGIELCMAIRRTKELVHIPLILTSSTFTHIDDEDRALAAKVGANAFVVRTPGLREVVGALRAALASGQAPRISSDATEAHEEYSRRLMRQLEHQAAINSSLLQRTAMDAALLSIAGAAAQVTAKEPDLGETLNKVLSFALDAGGVTSGSIYLVQADGSFELRAVVGHHGEERQPTAEFFGHLDLLRRSIATEQAVVIPSASVAPAVSRDLLVRAQAAGLLIAPLLSQGVPYGALVMATSEEGMTSEWLTSAATVAAQLAQTVALSKTVDDLKISERALDEKQRRFRQLADNVSEVFFVMDSEFRETLYINPAYERVWGRSCQSLYDDPKSFLESVVPEDRDAIMQNIAHTLRGEAPKPLDFRIERSDGALRWISSTVVPIRDPAGSVYRFSGVSRDITERVEVRLALEESVARYQKLTETSFDAIGIVQDGVVKEVNPGFVRTFGYDTADEIIGRPIADFASERSRAMAQSRVDNNVEGSAEIECVRKDGRTIIAEVTSRMHTLNGRPARLTALRDVTEKRTLEVQFQQAQKMEAVGRLAGGVAHDFNNLLTVILGHTEMLIAEMAPDDPRAEDLGQVRDAANRASGLTRQLLAFSRQQVVEPRDVDVADIVKGTKRMLDKLIGEDIEIVLRRGSEDCVSHVDPGQLEQVVMNLAVNARDAMPTGGTLTIETSVTSLDEEQAMSLWPAKPGRFGVLTVHDTGVGMDDVTREKVFEPFFTTKEKGKGTGLGLATVQGIVQQAGGFVVVESAPGSGSTFRIYLPLVDASVAVLAADADTVEVPGGTETILLAEDDHAVRHVARRILSRSGYIILEADSPLQALAAARRQGVRIQLLLTDVVMPQMSGRALAEQFVELHPNAKVLYMSGYTDDAIVRNGVLTAEMPYLQKPFTPYSLATKVRAVIDN